MAFIDEVMKQMEKWIPSTIISAFLTRPSSSSSQLQSDIHYCRHVYWHYYLFYFSFQSAIYLFREVNRKSRMMFFALQRWKVNLIEIFIRWPRLHHKSWFLSNFLFSIPLLCYLEVVKPQKVYLSIRLMR